jgi:fucose permease
MKNSATPIFLVFLAMGFGDAVGPFVGLAKETFALSNFQAQIIPFVGFLMFGLLSIPMGILQDKTGKKPILLTGLIIALGGLVLPIFGLNQYLLFLLTILLLGAGAAILQVAGNPIMRDVSAPGTYARNLTFGQFIKAIGSLSGSLIPFVAARWLGMDWSVLFPIYSVALLITILWVWLTPIKERNKTQDDVPASFSSCISLLNHKMVLAMVLGIFLYVGAEVTISSSAPLLLSENFGIDLQTFGILGNTFFFLAIIIGRFAGTLVLNRISPVQFFKICCLFALVGLVLMGLPVQALSILGIALTGLAFANIFPLIFSITVEAMPERSNEISGLMVTAIVGGAFIPPLVGFVADTYGLSTSLVVPGLAVVYLLVISLNSKKWIHAKA